MMIDLRAIHCFAGNCPASAALGKPNHIEGDGKIYRRSFRSVTMRCNDCGLLWTVTIHQLAKVARLYTDSNPDDRFYKEWAAMFEEWAEMINDQRGKRRGRRAIQF